jgi:4-diphosphocytidyl-2-C-methyl-D-erythritol kinase
MGRGSSGSGLPGAEAGSFQGRESARVKLLPFHVRGVPHNSEFLPVLIWGAEFLIRSARPYNHGSMTVTLRSFAKINLGLRIGGARLDGFHDLLTVYQTIALHDVIRVSVARGSGIEIRCEDARVPRDETNTCWRVVESAMSAFGAKGRVLIDIEKRLPVQGGLGGASANAITTLLGLERALRKSLPGEERLRIAAAVGSDLPLFLIGGTVLGVGRGEQVYPLKDLPAIDCVVVTPQIGVSTPKAFAEWDQRVAQGLKPTAAGNADTALKRRPPRAAQPGQIPTSRNNDEMRGTPADQRHQHPAPLAFGFAGTDGCVRPYMSSGKLTVGGASDRINELGRGLSAWLSEPYSSAPFRRGRAENPLLGLVRAGIENDFEEVVFPECPELCEAKRALVRAGAKYASLSGSGSTLYGLFASAAAAGQAAAKLRKQGWTAQQTKTLTRRGYWRRMIGP